MQCLECHIYGEWTYSLPVNGLCSECGKFDQVWGCSSVPPRLDESYPPVCAKCIVENGWKEPPRDYMGTPARNVFDAAGKN